MLVPEERFETYARGRPYHAALVDLRGDSLPHGHHDYYEVMVVAEGEGEQRLATGTQRLERGDVVLVRPGDQHGLSGAEPDGMRFFNIAFPATTWHGFTALAALAGAGGWDAAPLPPLNTAAPQAVAVEACRLALERFHEAPTTLDLVRFWTEMVPLLPEAAPAPSGAPGWLVATCAAMREEEHLRAGLPRMLALAHVSPAHLSRTMRRHLRTTPTAFLGELRLRHAATLLATTEAPVTEIAERCGFGSASYFTRCFHRTHQVAPRDFRYQTRRAFVP
ncbi:AraC family transcriptional regulator [Streptomyces sp. TS71-3]|uniref:helix-turn-helix transcriptional regulator n=1 Tax=Streptomyces sp. TS71-3 TaxID=2733862 RepID=UPI001B262374|nr:helix-turn-helix domain-containing protein [Streptomyces sp. TS71-3]GHJ37524.1 transcriptional regulator ChbR [Streptomyces sp. TS71-3]